MSLQTRYEFTLPRGYVDDSGAVHRSGVMRLATARDELEPLRDPTISGPDDPRLTVIVLARVVERLGSLDLVTIREIESLFAADLAYLQDFYGVINFGTQAEYEAFVSAESAELVSTSAPAAASTPAVADAAPIAAEASSSPQAPEDEPVAPAEPADVPAAPRPGRSAIEEIPSESR
ncbi:hypothetical protein GCM10010401_12800 [Rarobacter faecitabidus]|uniref:Uncharacterized protein n=1 Tax=Rarobacter faecitabidus TaxID=13243 RepID=A0A542Z8K0_RARFA|nr:hypothetical protein [Rarobacter faecitabidus]TQL56673.1 hypothetical protein FB461_2396 [Rarobacter faecitabidus]